MRCGCARNLAAEGVVWLPRFTTKFGSLDDYEKGHVEVIDDDPRTTRSPTCSRSPRRSRPYEKVAVGKNSQYVLEAIRAEGTSDWRTCAHDEFALVMDGEVEIQLRQARATDAGARRGSEGRSPLDGEPGGPRWAGSSARRGHMTLLPAGAAYQFHAEAPGVILLQTQGRPRHRRAWAEICPDHARGRRPRSDETAMRPMTIAESGRIDAQRVSATGTSRWASSGSAATSTSSTSTGPPARHVMPADAFLRALMRDVAWGFFYGMVNFDGVIGTVNHYGTVDMFAGRYNDGYRKAELDHLENFADRRPIRATFKAMLDDWTNEGYDPFAARTRPARAFGRKNGDNRKAITRHRVDRRPHGRRARATSRSAPTTTATRSTAMFADVPQDEPEIHAEPGFENEVACVQPVRLPVALRRDLEPVGRLGRARTACSARPPRSTSCRSSTATTGSSGSSSCRDEIDWDIEDRDTGQSAAKVVMKAGDVAAMPADIRHQGYAPKRVDAAGLGERLAGRPARA